MERLVISYNNYDYLKIHVDGIKFTYYYIFYMRILLNVLLDDALAVMNQKNITCINNSH